jgi:hypothetical protein
VNVVFTLVVFAAAGMWFLAVYRRLARLREQVKLAWKRLETDQSNEAARSVYNRHVALYNDALEAFPANLVGPAAGFKAARPYNS